MSPGKHGFICGTGLTGKLGYALTSEGRRIVLSRRRLWKIWARVETKYVARAKLDAIKSVAGRE